MKYISIAELGRVVTGKTPPTNHSEYFGGKIPFITPSDIETYDKRYVEYTERTLTTQGASSIKGCLLPPKSICFVCIGSTIGKSCMTKCVSYTNQQINSIIPNQSCIGDYLFYLLKFIKGYFQSVGGGTGAGKGIVNKTLFQKTKVEIHNDLNVQQRIASILTAYDDLIENNNRRIKILEQMAENLYKEWFVRFRFPGYEQAEFENGIPKGWEIRRFSNNIAKITAGGDRPEVYSPYKSDICTVPIFSNGTDDYGLYGYTNHPKIYEESVTVSARGTVGYVCLREEPYVPIVRLLSLVPVDKEISAKFIYYALKTDCIEGNGTSQQQMTVPMFGRKKILIPDRKLIAKFTAIVDDLFSLRRNHMIANQNLTKQRDKLLPRLMSGKLEV